MSTRLRLSYPRASRTLRRVNYTPSVSHTKLPRSSCSPVKGDKEPPMDTNAHKTSEL